MFYHILAFAEIHDVQFLVLNDLDSSFNNIFKNETISWCTESKHK